MPEFKDFFIIFFNTVLWNTYTTAITIDLLTNLENNTYTPHNLQYLYSYFTPFTTLTWLLYIIYDTMLHYTLLAILVLITWKNMMPRDWERLLIIKTDTLTPDKYHNLFPYDKIKNHVKTNIYTALVFYVLTIFIHACIFSSFYLPVN